MRNGRRSPLKYVTVCFWPFSLIRKSCPVRPSTGSPRLSRTETGTRTDLVEAPKVRPRGPSAFGGGAA